MGKILITGASGFIGSWLVAEALHRGHQVVAGVRSTSSRQYLQDPRIAFLELDLRNQERLEEQLRHQHLTAVIHNAGATSVGKREDFFRVNTELTKNLAKAYARTHSPNRFVFMSSLAANGPAHLQVDRVLHPQSAHKPVTVYGESKLAADKFLKTEMNDLNWVSLRPTAVYGPRERDIFDFFKMVKYGFEPYVGTAPQKLSFIYVKDLAALAVRVAEMNNGAHQFYPVSDGKIYAPDDLGAFAKAALNKKTYKLKVPISVAKGVARVVEAGGKITGKYPTFSLEKVQELSAASWEVDIRSLRDQFAFEPKYDLQSGVAETIDWYRQNNWL